MMKKENTMMKDHGKKVIRNTEKDLDRENIQGMKVKRKNITKIMETIIKNMINREITKDRMIDGQEKMNMIEKVKKIIDHLRGMISSFLVMKTQEKEIVIRITRKTKIQ